MTVQRKDLVDIGDSDYFERQSEFMQCQDCQTTIGGTRGDYWQTGIEDIFHCPTCDSVNIALVIETRKVSIVKQ